MAVPSLSVEQVDQKIHEHERQIEELRLVRATILKYSENGSSPAKQVIRRFPRTRKAPNSTGLRAAILGLNFTSSFKGDMVVDQLQAMKFDFKKRDPKAAVRDCLYLLAKKGRIRLIKQGRGGQQSLYEKDQ